MLLVNVLYEYIHMALEIYKIYKLSRNKLIIYISTSYIPHLLKFRTFHRTFHRINVIIMLLNVNRVFIVDSSVYSRKIHF